MKRKEAMHEMRRQIFAVEEPRRNEHHGEVDHHGRPIERHDAGDAMGEKNAGRSR